MAMQLRITGETLRLTGDPVSGTVIITPVPGDVLLATESGETLETESGDGIAVEQSHGN